MGLSDFLKKAKDLAGDETVNAVVKKIASNKKVKETISKAKKKVSTANKTVSKFAKSLGIDLTQVLSIAMKNQDVINVLGKLGLKKKEDPASSAVQKLVGSLKTAINKATGQKVNDDAFGSIITKLMGNATVKSKVEDIAGSGVATFIKKAVSEYIS